MIQQRLEKEQKEAERRRQAVEERQRQRKSLQVQLDTAAKIAEEATETTNGSSSVVVMRKKTSSDASVPSYQRHSMAEDQMDGDGYSRYSNQTQPEPTRRITLHESGYKTADELMQQMNEDERRRKASYSMLQSRLTSSAQVSA